MAKSLAKEVVLLADIAKAFAESLNLEATLESILKALESHLELERGAITLLDPETETIGIKVAHGLPDASKKQITYKVGEGITGLVVQTGKEVVVPDISKDPRFLAKTGQRPRSKGQKIAFFCVPIKLEGRAIGAISVDRKVRPADDFDAHVRLLEVIATMVAQAVKLNKLVESDRRELKDENERLLRELKTRFNIHNMVGTSGAMQEVYRLIEQVANSNATVLIRGESCTGKDLVAHAIHYNSYRSAKPFIKVNCTALPENLLESELFGHEKGAFTDAVSVHKGKFEQAADGTIFLDEVGDMSLPLQAKVLRVLQDRTYDRVGGKEVLISEARVIAATNQDLETLVREKRFREDLYYRLNVVTITLPPLRERKEDIQDLVDHFIKKYCSKYNKIIAGVSPQAMKFLGDYDWPGNVRELENAIARAVIIANSPLILPEYLPHTITSYKAREPMFQNKGAMPKLHEAVEELEAGLIKRALKETKGNRTKAAELLGIPRRSLYTKIQEYNIGLDEIEPDNEI